MKRIISTLAGICTALSLVTTTAHAGTILSATNTQTAVVDGIHHSVRRTDPVETFWPYCELGGCATRVMTLDAGMVEDVILTVDWSWSNYSSEGYLNLWHDGTSVTLTAYIIGPSGIVTFDDDAARPYDGFLSGTIQPAQPLSAFDGHNSAGDWVLTIADFDDQDPRTFNSATLLVTVSEPGTLALLSIALAGLGFARRRKLH
jgi:PEP-CTERM motif